jgi:hypothetical protein
MDQHLWESIHRLALITEKINFQRMDHDTGPQRESDEEIKIKQTWNDFQQMLTSNPHPYWTFEPRRANSFQHYQGIIGAFLNIQMGVVRFRNGSTISFQVKVHESKPEKMTLTGLRRSPSCPIQLNQFNMDEGTARQIFNHLNQLSQPSASNSAPQGAAGM